LALRLLTHYLVYYRRLRSLLPRQGKPYVCLELYGDGNGACNGIGVPAGRYYWSTFWLAYYVCLYCHWFALIIHVYGLCISLVAELPSLFSGSWASPEVLRIVSCLACYLFIFINFFGPLTGLQLYWTVSKARYVWRVAVLPRLIFNCCLVWGHCRLVVLFGYFERKIEPARWWFKRRAIVLAACATFVFCGCKYVFVCVVSVLFLGRINHDYWFKYADPSIECGTQRHPSIIMSLYFRIINLGYWSRCAWLAVKLFPFMPVLANVGFNGGLLGVWRALRFGGVFIRRI